NSEALDLNPWVFHWADLIIHIGNALLLFVLLRRIVRHELAAALEALSSPCIRCRWKQRLGSLPWKICSLGCSRYSLYGNTLNLPRVRRGVSGTGVMPAQLQPICWLCSPNPRQSPSH